MADDFCKRLRLAALRGRLTKSDMTRWFGRPGHTVWHWFNGTVPWGPNGEEARRKLAVLEGLIAKGKDFPMPFELTPQGRIKYLEGIINGRDARIPRARAAK